VRPTCFTKSEAMNRLITGALLVTLSCIPALAQAETTLAPQATVGKVTGNHRQARSEPIDISPGSASDYAAREATASQLAEFAGGGGGVYIGTGALVVGLIVLIVILVVH
jgi:outer membrane receptor protein involved in Fe transport